MNVGDLTHTCCSVSLAAWLQPPAHVHAMITESWQPNSVNFTLGSACGRLNLTAGDLSASASADGKSASVRIVNQGAAPLAIKVALATAMLAICRHTIVSIPLSLQHSLP